MLCLIFTLAHSTIGLCVRTLSSISRWRLRAVL